MDTAHGAEELGLCPHGLACQAGASGRYHRVLPRIWPYLRNGLLGMPAKIFCEAHNFVPWWNFDKRVFAWKAWDAGDADRGIARVNRAPRARAIGTYLLGHFLVLHL
jgi:hypothetical protein